MRDDNEMSRELNDTMKNAEEAMQVILAKATKLLDEMLLTKKTDIAKAIEAVEKLEETRIFLMGAMARCNGQTQS